MAKKWINTALLLAAGAIGIYAAWKLLAEPAMAGEGLFGGGAGAGGGGAGGVAQPGATYNVYITQPGQPGVAPVTMESVAAVPTAEQAAAPIGAVSSRQLDIIQKSYARQPSQTEQWQAYTAGYSYNPFTGSFVPSGQMRVSGQLPGASQASAAFQSSSPFYYQNPAHSQLVTTKYSPGFIPAQQPGTVR